MQFLNLLLSSVLCQRLPSAPITLSPQVTFCAQSGSTESTGQQQRNGEQMCSSTVQGLIPDVSNLVSTMITAPVAGSTIDSSKGFQVQFTTINLMAGTSVNLNNQFLLAPQSLASNGKIEGFEQLVIQAIGDVNRAPSAFTTSFFQTLTQSSDANGKPTFVVNVPPRQISTTGIHRICTMAASAGGQPVVMPVAQRGSQDDCIRINVTNGGGNPGKGNKR